MRRALLVLSAVALLAYDLVRATDASASLKESGNHSAMLLVEGEVLGAAASRFGGCALCRDSGNCSIAVENAASGVFCGDLAGSREPCCCAYQTACRVTALSSACECASGEDGQSAQRSRLQAAEPDAEDSQMSASTEILIHLSAYLALFVIATFVDDWVDCCRDFRRSQLVYNALDKGILRLKEKYKRRRDVRASAREATLFSDSEDDDESPGMLTDAPLLLGMSPVARTPDVDVDSDRESSLAPPAEPVEEMGMDRVA